MAGGTSVVTLTAALSVMVDLASYACQQVASFLCSNPLHVSVPLMPPKPLEALCRHHSFSYGGNKVSEMQVTESGS